MDNFENQNTQEQPAVQPEMQPNVQPEMQQVVQPMPEQPAYQQPMHPQSSYQPPVPQAKKKSGGTVWKVLIAGALIISLVLCSCLATAAGVTAYWKQQNKLLSQSLDEKMAALRQELEDKAYVGSGDSISGSPNVTPDGSLTPAQVYAKHVASVVAIECTVGAGYTQGSASGSGFVLTEDGYIATNYHVVEDARTITITCSNGNSYNAAMVGGDEANDIAVIKADATGLQKANIGRSDHLIVGDQVAAIGNPLGTLASTLTVGYISAKDRMVTTEGTSINMLQTDAAINPGNSGGPLFNMKGEVIGITSAKYSGTTESGASIEGIGFAIPVDDVIGMIQDLMEKGYISGTYLGVMVRDVTNSVSQAYGLPLGALVDSVEPGYCAEAAGIRAKDVIVNLGGYDVKCVSDLTRALRKFEPGDTVTVTVFRISAGGEVTLSLTLQEKPNTNNQPQMPSQDTTKPNDPPSSGSPDDWFDHFFGN